MLRLGIEFGVILKNGLISVWFAVLCGDKRNMRKSLKIATVAAVAFLALAAVALAYAYAQNNYTTNGNGIQIGTWNMRTYFQSNNVTLPDNATGPCYEGRMGRMRGNDLWNGEFLQNATLSTVQGTVVSEVKGMLVLDTGSGEIRVMLPNDWIVGNEVIGRTSLFNGTFASEGQNVTVKVLESDVFTNASFSLNTMLGYEVINATSIHAYAVLPFNIQPSS
jgi:hypothetical protein